MSNRTRTSWHAERKRCERSQWGEWHPTVHRNLARDLTDTEAIRRELEEMELELEEDTS